MKIEIKAPFAIPSGTPQQRRHGSAGKTYKSKSLSFATASWKALLEQYAPVLPYDEPMRIVVTLNYHSPTKNSYKTTRPDGVNLLKLIEDCMASCRYFTDDKFLVDERIIRRWTTGEENIEITIETL